MKQDVGHTVTAVDLFCGAGGFSLGLQRAGIKILWAADFWKPAVETYRHNFSHPVLEIDLSQVTAQNLLKKASQKPPIDIVVGGPPCQGFSIQRIGEDHDLRNNLVLEFGRLVGELGARAFVMENVPGLLGKRGGNLGQLFGELMVRRGYVVESTIVNAVNFGVPQNRRRVIYYGWKHGGSPVLLPQSIPTTDSVLTVKDAIGDLPPPPDDYTPHPLDLLHRRTRLSKINLERIKLIPPGGGMEDLPVEMRAQCHRNGASRIGHRYVYGRLAPDKPASTITAHFDSFTRGRFGHPFEDRNITLREGARLQTFPDDFRFFGTQEQVAALIGNAVPPLVAEHLGRALWNALTDPHSSKSMPSNTAGNQLGLIDSEGA